MGRGAVGDRETVQVAGTRRNPSFWTKKQRPQELGGSQGGGDWRSSSTQAAATPGQAPTDPGQHDQDPGSGAALDPSIRAGGAGRNLAWLLAVDSYS